MTDEPSARYSNDGFVLAPSLQNWLPMSSDPICASSRCRLMNFMNWLTQGPRCLSRRRQQVNAKPTGV